MLLAMRPPANPSVEPSLTQERGPVCDADTYSRVRVAWQVYELIRVAAYLVLLAEELLPRLPAVLGQQQTRSARGSQNGRIAVVDDRAMDIGVRHVDVRPRTAAVRAFEQPADLDAHVHVRGVVRVEVDVLQVRLERVSREAPPGKRFDGADFGKLGPAHAHVVAVVEVRGLRAGEQSRAALDLRGSEAEQTTDVDARIARLPGFAAVDAGVNAVPPRAGEHRAAHEQERVDMLADQRMADLQPAVAVAAQPDHAVHRPDERLVAGQV